MKIKIFLKNGIKIMNINKIDELEKVISNYNWEYIS